MSAGTLYTLKVVASAAAYWASPPAELQQRTRLPTPTGFRASPSTSKGHEDITLNWTAVSGATKYTVYYSKNASDLNNLGSFAAGSDAKAKGKAENITTATKTIEGLAIYTTYYFKLVAHESTPSEATNSLPATAEGKTTKIQVADRAGLIAEIKKAYTGYGTVATEDTVTDKGTKTGATASLNHIDTSQVTDMSYLFKGKEHFNGDISDWDTSKVTTMKQMFGGTTTSGSRQQTTTYQGAKAFNQNIGGWDVSKVTDMSGMFQSANKFNQPIGTWDVSGITQAPNMVAMFMNASDFSQDLSAWEEHLQPALKSSKPKLIFIKSGMACSGGGDQTSCKAKWPQSWRSQ